MRSPWQEDLDLRGRHPEADFAADEGVGHRIAVDLEGDMEVWGNLTAIDPLAGLERGHRKRGERRTLRLGKGALAFDPVPVPPRA